MLLLGRDWRLTDGFELGSRDEEAEPDQLVNAETPINGGWVRDVRAVEVYSP